MSNSIEWSDVTAWSYTNIPGEYAYDGSRNEGPAIYFGDGTVVESVDVATLVATLRAIADHAESVGDYAPTTATCRHCARTITERQGAWFDLAPDGDDALWAEVCDSHDTFDAHHEPTGA